MDHQQQQEFNSQQPLHSIILQEEDLKNYEPGQQEILEYAKYLGFDIEQDQDFLWIAREGLTAGLPQNWKACQTQNGEIYYFNFESGESSWEHPLDNQFREIYQREKKNKLQNKTQDQDKLQTNIQKQLQNNNPPLIVNNVASLIIHECEKEESEKDTIENEFKRSNIIQFSTSRSVSPQYQIGNKQEKNENWVEEQLKIIEQEIKGIPLLENQEKIKDQMFQEIQEWVRKFQERERQEIEEKKQILIAENEWRINETIKEIQSQQINQISELEKEIIHFKEQDLQIEKEIQEIEQNKNEQKQKIQELDEDFEIEKQNLINQINKNTREILQNEQNNFEKEVLQLQKIYQNIEIPSNELEMIQSNLKAQYENELKEFQEKIYRETEDKKLEILQELQNQSEEDYKKEEFNLKKQILENFKLNEDELNDENLDFKQELSQIYEQYDQEIINFYKQNQGEVDQIMKRYQEDMQLRENEIFKIKEENNIFRQKKSENKNKILQDIVNLQQEMKQLDGKQNQIDKEISEKKKSIEQLNVLRSERQKKIDVEKKEKQIKLEILQNQIKEKQYAIEKLQTKTEIHNIYQKEQNSSNENLTEIEKIQKDIAYLKQVLVGFDFENYDQENHQRNSTSSKQKNYDQISLLQQKQQLLNDKRLYIEQNHHLMNQQLHKNVIEMMEEKIGKINKKLLQFKRNSRNNSESRFSSQNSSLKRDQSFDFNRELNTKIF